MPDDLLSEAAGLVGELRRTAIQPTTANIARLIRPGRMPARSSYEIKVPVMAPTRTSAIEERDDRADRRAEEAVTAAEKAGVPFFFMTLISACPSPGGIGYR